MESKRSTIWASYSLDMVENSLSMTTMYSPAMAFASSAPKTAAAGSAWAPAAPSATEARAVAPARAAAEIRRIGILEVDIRGYSLSGDPGRGEGAKARNPTAGDGSVKPVLSGFHIEVREITSKCEVPG